jgi:MFS family permease
LRHRDFRLLLIGQTTSQLGTQVSAVAIPLLAVLTLDASPLQLGLVTAAGTVAFAVAGLPAGAWLDRCRRRLVLVASDLARAALLATIPLAALFGVLTITQLVVVSLLAGLARVFFDIGYQSYLPTVVGEDGLLTGNSAMETVRASGQIAGPGVGGWLVAVAGAATVVLVQAVTFAVSAVSLLAIGTREPRPAGPADRTPIRTRIREGLVFVTRTPVLRATAATSALGNLAFAVAAAVNVVFTVRTLGITPTTLGVVLAAGSVAALAGAALTPRLVRRVGSARVLWLSLAVTGPATVLTPLAPPTAWAPVLLVAGTAAGELGQIVHAISSVSLRQRLCPERMLSRVNATTRVLVMGLFPAGALLGGALGELLGARTTLWIATAIVVISPLPVYRALRHTRDVEDLPAWQED